MFISKIEKKFMKMLMVLKIITLELVARTFLTSEKNTCDRPPTCLKAVVGFQT